MFISSENVISSFEINFEKNISSLNFDNFNLKFLSLIVFSAWSDYYSNKQLWTDSQYAHMRSFPTFFRNILQKCIRREDSKALKLIFTVQHHSDGHTDNVPKVNNPKCIKVKPQNLKTFVNPENWFISVCNLATESQNYAFLPVFSSPYH